MGCAHSGPHNHSIHRSLGDRDIQWLSDSAVIKPIPQGLHMKSTSWLIGRVPFGIYRGRWAVPLHRVSTLDSGFYAVHQAGCSLGGPLPCVCITHSHLRLSVVSCVSCCSPDMLFHLETLRTKDTAPNRLLIIHFSTGSSGSL